MAPNRKSLWLFLITIPFWTNLLIRTFAIMEVIRNQGLLNTALIGLGVIASGLLLYGVVGVRNQATDHAGP